MEQEHSFAAGALVSGALCVGVGAWLATFPMQERAVERLSGDCNENSNTIRRVGIMTAWLGVHVAALGALFYLAER